jgi:hypothetical protein
VRRLTSEGRDLIVLIWASYLSYVIWSTLDHFYF